MAASVWARACDETRTALGEIDEAQARARFHVLAAWIAAHGERPAGPRGPGAPVAVFARTAAVSSFDCSTTTSRSSRHASASFVSTVLKDGLP